MWLYDFFDIGGLTIDDADILREEIQTSLYGAHFKNAKTGNIETVGLYEYFSKNLETYEILVDALRWRSMHSFDQKYAYILDHYLSTKDSEPNFDDQKYAVNYNSLTPEGKEIIFPGKSGAYEIGVINVDGGSEKIALNISDKIHSTPESVRSIRNSLASFRSTTENNPDIVILEDDIQIDFEEKEEFCGPIE